MRSLTRAASPPAPRTRRYTEAPASSLSARVRAWVGGLGLLSRRPGPIEKARIAPGETQGAGIVLICTPHTDTLVR